ncbi:hypothetical protein [Streptomyces kasugaensis]|nr:hypothetical protein [Streptomyces kasugaensis]
MARWPHSGPDTTELKRRGRRSPAGREKTGTDGPRPDDDLRALDHDQGAE